MTSIKPYYAAWLEDSDEYYVNSFFETEEEVHTFLEGSNLSVPLRESGVKIVELSKQLFDYLQEVITTKPYSLTVTGKGHQPTLPTIPYTELKYDQAKLDLREFLWKEMQEEDPRLLGMKNDDSLRFQSWQPILKETHSQIVYNQEFPWFSESLETQHTRIVEEDSRDLDIKGIYLTHLNGKQDIEPLTTSKVLSRREIKGTSNFFAVSPKPSRTFSKYDFNLEGERVAIIGLPKSQVERFKSLVLTEKKAEELEFINSSSHNDTEVAPEKLKDFDIVVVVKRFVGHSTINILKSVLGSSSAQLVSSSSHGLDGLERALYRGVKGYPSEEGAIVVDYPLLSR